MFSRRLLSVANMDPAYLAKYDGSEQAAGRGSGYTQPEPWTATPWQLQGKEPEEKIAGGVLKQLRDRDRAAFGENLRERAEQTASPGGAVGGTPYMSMTYAPLERRIDVAIHRALFASSVRQARQYVIHGAVKVNGQVVRVIFARSRPSGCSATHSEMSHVNRLTFCHSADDLFELLA